MENVVNRLDNLNQIKKALNSSIMQKDEFDMIYHAIKERKNTEIKEIKKLYQATIDSGEAEIFHKKCDNIQNTLVLYKSAGNRRFGAFASKCWRGIDDIIDNNCFLFSLDRQKIYYPKNEEYFKLACYSYDGPGFVISSYYCIKLYKNALQTKSLK